MRKKAAGKKGRWRHRRDQGGRDSDGAEHAAVWPDDGAAAGEGDEPAWQAGTPGWDGID